jgi:uncharacterized protein YndB with AHSA1/START domain
MPLRIVICSVNPAMLSLPARTASPLNCGVREYSSQLARSAHSSTWRVRLQCCVAAELRRVFHALTIPEFMETWLSPPCCDRPCKIRPSRSPHGFALEHSCTGSAFPAQIVCFYSSFGARHLSFSWTFEGNPASGHSFVDVRLSGHRPSANLDQCTLGLVHSGLRSEAHGYWQQIFWSASLKRLRELLAPPASVFPRPRATVNPPAEAAIDPAVLAAGLSCE